MKSRHQLNGTVNKLAPEDKPAHDWYRFVLSYPPHLVADYLKKFDFDSRHVVLDPFCGTGTTPVECKKRGIASVGIEANPMAHFAAEVKLSWGVDPDDLLRHAQRIAAETVAELQDQGIAEGQVFVTDSPRPAGLALREFTPEAQQVILTDSVSPLPLHKVLVLLDHIRRNSDERFTRHELLALAKAVVSSISNLRFGPEIGVGQIKTDSPVVEPWLAAVGRMASDLRGLRDRDSARAIVHLADARQVMDYLEPESIDGIITSPPYPNEKDYTRTTRLESVLLGLLNNRAELKALKQGLMRSNTRNVYKNDGDDEWVLQYPEIQRLSRAIEDRRIELGKTSGFEKLYARVTRLYFGGMARHLAAIRSILRPGAHLAYVVGDQASYLQVMIRTGQILADIGKQLGYEIESIDLFRTRFATATKVELREEVVVMRWPGDKPKHYANGRKSMAKKMPDSDGTDDEAMDEAMGLGLAGLIEPEPVLSPKKQVEYDKIIELTFTRVHNANPDATELAFTLLDVKQASADLELPQGNYPDIKYTFSGRRSLPDTILAHGHWAIVGAGKGKYKFVRLQRPPYVTIPGDLNVIKILDSTPQIVLKYQGSDEQSTLARIRYNRLVDTFTGLTTYHMQSHLRATAKGFGQVEIDDLYIGIDVEGKGFVIPLEAKSEGDREQLGVVQITQMIRYVQRTFPELKVRPLAVKMSKGSFIFIEFNVTDDPDLLASDRYRRYELYREK